MRFNAKTYEWQSTQLRHGLNRPFIYSSHSLHEQSSSDSIAIMGRFLHRWMKKYICEAVTQPGVVTLSGKDMWEAVIPAHPRSPQTKYISLIRLKFLLRVVSTRHKYTGVFSRVFTGENYFIDGFALTQYCRFDLYQWFLSLEATHVYGPMYTKAPVDLFSINGHCTCAPGTTSGVLLRFSGPLVRSIWGKSI